MESLRERMERMKRDAEARMRAALERMTTGRAFDIDVDGRRSRCANCPHRIERSVPLTGLRYDACAKCGCAIEARIRLSCPEGRW